MRSNKRRQIAQGVDCVQSQIIIFRKSLLDLAVDIFLLLAFQVSYLLDKLFLCEFDGFIQSFAAQTVLIVQHIFIGEDAQRLSDSEGELLVQVADSGAHPKHREAVPRQHFDEFDVEEVDGGRSELLQTSVTFCSSPIMKA